MKKLLFISSLSLLFNSCGGWSDSDKKNFLDDCEKAKFSTEYCDCALNKVVEKYSSFDDMVEDEENTAKLFFGCIEEDRSKSEN